MIAIGVGMTYALFHRRCLNCGAPSVGKSKSCARAECRRVLTELNRGYRVTRIAKESGRCVHCARPRQPGRTVCADHVWQKQPCERVGCGNRIPYRDGGGRPKRYCSEACRDLAATKPARVALSDEVRRELLEMLAAGTGAAKRRA